ncbi:4-hydroxymandelate oxidase [Thermocatellispora tengchongensis]|uniref:4-hydroxymandelate oxidase n=1 Tax=Thermocatellispora tengchongensis TaxID=1073253 RepID=A0A840PPB8_9ACTN|nr:alpha-hydroxy acid oxidase [Thermocatellispora tengchongensis]MBB5139621.1 4-hydroxymandelate oxidase [Thermocatellispora tengchongensis]
MTADLSALLTPADAEAAAGAVLPPGVERFVNGGSGDELTLRANRAAFDRIHITPRALVDVSRTGTQTRLLGRPAAMPVAVAPMAYQRAVHPGGELATARAAREHGIPFTATTFSSVPIEEIAAVGAETWFQLYWLRDRARTKDLLQRAEAAGCTALMLTVDTPRMARRRADLRSGFTLPPGVTAAHFTADPARHAGPGASAVAEHASAAIDPSLSWQDLDWLREHTALPLILKGLLHPADAGRALRAGAQAIVVSNHGGRQLDGAPPAIDALPAIAEATAGRGELLLDSGVRTGTDVLKALTRGATGVLLGRPALWGLALAGAEGVSRILGLLREELTEALALSGHPTPTAARCPDDH